MGFRSIRFFNFRNVADVRLHVEAPEVFFIGENGQGKTNILEAVYCLCLGSSFRTRSDERMLRFGQQELALEGCFVHEGGESETVVLRWGPGGKQISLDGKAICDRKTLLERFPCIVFCHEDIEFVKGSPERRRLFFDQTLCLYDFVYLEALRRYQRVLRARNRAIKEGRLQLLDAYDEQMIEHGARVQAARETVVREFNEAFIPLFNRVSALPEPLSISYQPSWRSAVGIAAALARSRDRDLALGSTSGGPHRDRYVFSSAGTDFAANASTGQIRLISLALKTAQAVFVHAKTGRRPVLLLDDVLLELDPERRRRFLECLPVYDQSFFTFLPDEQFLPFARSTTKMYSVHDGVVSEYGQGG